jgi:outer membrane protein assembly factor BamB
MNDFGGGPFGWGYAESPLIDGAKLVCTPGGKKGTIVALDKMTGELVWQSKDFTDGVQYSSIIPANINGTPQYVQVTMQSIVGINAKDGSVLWRSEWPGSTAVIPTPIVRGTKSSPRQATVSAARASPSAQTICLPSFTETRRSRITTAE